MQTGDYLPFAFHILASSPEDRARLEHTVRRIFLYEIREKIQAIAGASYDEIVEDAEGVGS